MMVRRLGGEILNIAKKSSRRSFLNLGAGAAAVLGMDLLSPLARAAGSGRAVVCIYLLGGNDSNNMVVPIDSPAYDLYAKARGPLALARESLLAVDSGGFGKFGFHPSLPGLRDLYGQNAAPGLANVGPSAMASNYTPAPHIRYVPNGYMGVDWSEPDVHPLRHGVTVASPGIGGPRGTAQGVRSEEHPPERQST